VPYCLVTNYIQAPRHSAYWCYYAECRYARCRGAYSQTDLIFVKEDEEPKRVIQGTAFDLDDAVVVVLDLPNDGLRIRVIRQRHHRQRGKDHEFAVGETLRPVL
jgi:hypothetical protein